MSYDANAVAASSSLQAEAPPRRRGRSVVITLLLVATLAMFTLAFLGITERESYAYAQRYGTQVEVSLADNCAVVVSRGRDEPWKDCSADWTIDGTEVEGRLFAGIDDALEEPFNAFAVGSKAFTEGYRPEGNPQLGLAPAWLFIPSPVTVIVLLKIYGKRIKRWASDDN